MGQRKSEEAAGFGEGRPQGSQEARAPPKYGGVVGHAFHWWEAAAGRAGAEALLPCRFETTQPAAKKHRPNGTHLAFLECIRTPGWLEGQWS